MKSILFIWVFLAFIFVRNQNNYEQNFLGSTNIQSDTISCGQKILIEVQRRTNGSVESVTRVSKIIDPAKTVVITMLCVVKVKGEKTEHLTMLKIDNPFNEGLMYDAEIKLSRKQEFETTDIIPIQPRAFCIESWYEWITLIKLSNWRFNSK